MTEAVLDELVRALGGVPPEEPPPERHSDLHPVLSRFLRTRWPHELHGQEQLADELWSVRFMSMGRRNGAYEIAHTDGGNYTLCVQALDSADPMVFRYDHEEPEERSMIARLSEILRGLGTERWEPPAPPGPTGPPPTEPPARIERELPPCPDGARRLGYRHADSSTGISDLSARDDGRWFAARYVPSDYTGEWEWVGERYSPVARARVFVLVWDSADLDAPRWILPRSSAPLAFVGEHLMHVSSRDLVLRDLSTGEIVRTFALGSERSTLHLVPGGFVVLRESHLTVRDLEWQVRLEIPLAGHREWISDVSPDGSLLAVGCDGSSAFSLIDLRTGTLGQLSTHLSGSPWSVRFSPDGAHLAVTNGLHTALVERHRDGWGAAVRHKTAGGVAWWTPQGHLLSTTSDQKTKISAFRIDTLDGTLLHEQSWPGGSLRSVRVLRSGRQVLTLDAANTDVSSLDPRLLLWDLPL